MLRARIIGKEWGIQSQQIKLHVDGGLAADSRAIMGYSSGLIGVSGRVFFPEIYKRRR